MQGPRPPDVGSRRPRAAGVPAPSSNNNREQCRSSTWDTHRWSTMKKFSRDYRQFLSLSGDGTSRSAPVWTASSSERPPASRLLVLATAASSVVASAAIRAPARPLSTRLPARVVSRSSCPYRVHVYVQLQARAPARGRARVYRYMCADTMTAQPSPFHSCCMLCTSTHAIRHVLISQSGLLHVV
jgi:hypothetical protein